MPTGAASGCLQKPKLTERQSKSTTDRKRQNNKATKKKIETIAITNKKEGNIPFFTFISRLVLS